MKRQERAGWGASQGHIKHLSSATHPEDRKPLLDELKGKLGLHSISLGWSDHSFLMFGGPIELRIDIASTEQ